jgi:hypothetical protein
LQATQAGDNSFLTANRQAGVRFAPSEREFIPLPTGSNAAMDRPKTAPGGSNGGVSAREKIPAWFVRSGGP